MLDLSVCGMPVALDLHVGAHRKGMSGKHAQTRYADVLNRCRDLWHARAEKRYFAFGPNARLSPLFPLHQQTYRPVSEKTVAEALDAQAEHKIVGCIA